jgi:hypothetical protein
MIPFCLAWAITESEITYTALMKGYMKAMDIYFGIKDLNIIMATADHAAYIK